MSSIWQRSLQHASFTRLVNLLWIDLYCTMRMGALIIEMVDEGKSSTMLTEPQRSVDNNPPRWVMSKSESVAKWSVLFYDVDALHAVPKHE